MNPRRDIAVLVVMLMCTLVLKVLDIDETAGLSQLRLQRNPTTPESDKLHSNCDHCSIVYHPVASKGAWVQYVENCVVADTWVDAVSPTR
jgi:hypothetical protein